MYIIGTLCCLHVVYREVAVYLSPHCLHAEVSNAFNFVSQEVLRSVSVLNFDKEGFLPFQFSNGFTLYLPVCQLV